MTTDVFTKLKELNEHELCDFLAGCNQNVRDAIFSHVRILFENHAAARKVDFKNLGPTEGFKFPLFYWAMFCNQANATSFLSDSFQNLFENRLSLKIGQDCSSILEDLNFSFLLKCVEYNFDKAVIDFMTFYYSLTTDKIDTYQSDLNTLFSVATYFNQVTLAAKLYDLGEGKKDFLIPFSFNKDPSFIQTLLLFNISTLPFDKRTLYIFQKLISFDQLKLEFCKPGIEIDNCFSEIHEDSFFWSIITKFSLKEIGDLLNEKLDQLNTVNSRAEYPQLYFLFANIFEQIIGLFEKDTQSEKETIFIGLKEKLENSRYFVGKEKAYFIQKIQNTLFPTINHYPKNYHDNPFNPTINNLNNSFKNTHYFFNPVNNNPSNSNQVNNNIVIPINHQVTPYYNFYGNPNPFHNENGQNNFDIQYSSNNK